MELAEAAGDVLKQLNVYSINVLSAHRMPEHSPEEHIKTAIADGTKVFIGISWNGSPSSWKYCCTYFIASHWSSR